MTDNNPPQAPSGEFIFFSSADNKVRIECRFESDTLWLSQSAMADLYQVSTHAINKHVSAIYEEGEIDQVSTCNDYSQVQNEGTRRVQRKILHHSLPLILAVGYRVRSKRGTQFRQWATQTLEEYVIKGFVMDDERLKNPPADQSVVPDYFGEMLERIRDIRASERRMYLRVREIFAMAADYQSSNKETTQFFQGIQNKLHFACTGYTAPELIALRVNSNEPNMGLTSFKGDEVLKSDVSIAKNYLLDTEISELNRVVTMWLDYSEDQALQRKQVFLQDWQTKLDQFLAFNDRNVLDGVGSVSRTSAETKANKEYEQFAVQRRTLKEVEGERANIDALISIEKEKGKR